MLFVHQLSPLTSYMPQRGIVPSFPRMHTGTLTVIFFPRIPRPTSLGCIFGFQKTYIDHAFHYNFHRVTFGHIDARNVVSYDVPVKHYSVTNFSSYLLDNRIFNKKIVTSSLLYLFFKLSFYYFYSKIWLILLYNNNIIFFNTNMILINYTIT
jgi:hypothetical protein